MHELALCESVLDIIVGESRKQGFARVKQVWLEVGEMAGVELQAMEFSFDVVTRGSIVESAALNILQIPGSAWCMQCSKNVAVRQRFDACPDCGSYQLQINGGDEMRIKELEVE